MGENAKKIGDKLEGFGKRLYERFGWTELIRDKEINCNKSSHKTDKGKDKHTHGIDLYHSYFDPYKNIKVGVITECKNYEWESIKPSNIQKWFDQLLETIECAQTSQDIEEFNKQSDGLNTGILLIHANNNKYNDSKFREYLTNIKYRTRRNAINIFIAGNKEIEKWNSMFDYIEQKNSGNSKFYFYYPSILGSSLRKLPYISLYQLFSSFIFAQSEVEVKTTTENKVILEYVKQMVLFSFDKISENSFQYICSMFKELQLEGADKYIIAFYPESNDDVQLIKDKFKKYACKQLDPDKVNYKILDNRNLSPVDVK